MCRTSTNNQQVLYELAVGTGGFVIVNTNDLLGGLQKIAHEQNEYYVLGYTPPPSDEGSCHTLKVKSRPRRDRSPLAQRLLQCEARGPAGGQARGKTTGKPMRVARNRGTVAASMRAPTSSPSANTARVNLAIDIPATRSSSKS